MVRVGRFSHAQRQKISYGGGSCRDRWDGGRYTFQLQNIVADTFFHHRKGATQYALVRVVFTIYHLMGLCVGLTLLLFLELDS